MNALDEKMMLVRKIANGEISKADVEVELDRISSEYGEGCFNSYVVSRKPRPWSKKDLDDLEVLHTSGASSREFYLYMAEVSEEVYSSQKKKKWLLVSLVIIAMVIIAVGMFAFVICKK